ncbi:hypothetical protein AAC387_Pa12g0670 [Persea americana]
MAGETIAPVNAEEQPEGENLGENIKYLVKQQNDRINQIAAQLQFLMERMTGPNKHPPATPSSSNTRDPHTSGARIDQTAAQIEQLSQMLSKQSGQFADSSRQTYLDEAMTYKDIADMLTKTRDDGRLKKKGIMPKYPPEMELDPYSPKYKPLSF